jgi:ribose transport system permease protein
MTSVTMSRMALSKGFGTAARSASVWILVAVVAAVLTVIKPGALWGPGGQDVLLQLTIIGILTVAQCVTILGGGIDLSVAAIVRVSSVVGAAYLSTPGASLLLGFLLVLGVGAVIGIVNGLLVGVAGLPPFLTTFAMLLVLDGLTLTFAPSAVGAVPSLLIEAYSWQVLWIPVPFLVLVLVVVVMALVLSRSVWGKSVYAVGGDRRLALHSGLPVRRVSASLYVVSGLLAGVTALVLLSRNGVGDPLAIQGMELLSVTAVVIGGVSLLGGRGSVVGAVAGAVFLTLISVALSQVGVPAQFVTLIQGVVIVLALATYRPRSRRGGL